MSTYRFSFPTLIHFGNGVRKKAGEHLKANGLKRPLLVTDKGVAALPMCKEIEKILSDAGLQVATFAGIWGNPVKSQVTEGVKAFKAHDADCIVGLGGGAALDVAKAI
ncbi:MAG: iron-containing alcohol dehydrogenase, partial [Bdellovibrionota bacterium]